MGVLTGSVFFQASKSGTKFGKETPFKKVGELLVAVSFSLEPLPPRSKRYTNAPDWSMCQSLGLNPQWACLAVQFS